MRMTTLTEATVLKRLGLRPWPAHFAVTMARTVNTTRGSGRTTFMLVSSIIEAQYQPVTVQLASLADIAYYQQVVAGFIERARLITHPIKFIPYPHDFGPTEMVFRDHLCNELVTSNQYQEATYVQRS